MRLTLEFLGNMAGLLGYVSPIFAVMALIIGVLSVVIGRREQWSLGDSLYFGFITALTVGYGDFRPTRRLGKFLAIIIALFGLITTGILVAVAVEALRITFDYQ